jgi:drug/metabolite transporter (DMT)-like permease
MKPTPLKIISILSLGVLCISLAAILVRQAQHAYGGSNPHLGLLIAAVRMLLAGTLLLPTTVSSLRKTKPSPRAVLFAALAGVFLALHLALWITSLSYTSVAISTVLVTTNPIWISLLMWLIFRQVPPKLTFLGIGFAILGSVIIGLTGGSGTLSSALANPLLGNGLALLGAITVSCYYLAGQQAQKLGLSIGLYAGIAYGTAGLVLAPWPLIVGIGYAAPLEVYFWIALTALIPQLLGHTIFNWAMRHVSPLLVTVVILLEPVGASLLAAWLFKENLIPSIIMGGLVLLFGVLITVWAEMKKGEPEKPVLQTSVQQP